MYSPIAAHSGNHGTDPGLLLAPYDTREAKKSPRGKTPATTRNVHPAQFPGCLETISTPTSIHRKHIAITRATTGFGPGSENRSSPISTSSSCTRGVCGSPITTTSASSNRFARSIGTDAATASRHVARIRSPTQRAREPVMGPCS